MDICLVSCAQVSKLKGYRHEKTFCHDLKSGSSLNPKTVAIETNVLVMQGGFQLRFFRHAWKFHDELESRP
jgi:hypothetical protein